MSAPFCPWLRSAACFIIAVSLASRMIGHPCRRQSLRPRFLSSTLTSVDYPFRREAGVGGCREGTGGLCTFIALSNEHGGMRRKRRRRGRGPALRSFRGWLGGAGAESRSLRSISEGCQIDGYRGGEASVWHLSIASSDLSGHIHPGSDPGRGWVAPGRRRRFAVAPLH